MSHHSLCTPAALLLALLLISPIAPAAARAYDQPIRALLVIGGCCHDYRNQKDALTKGISARANVQWKIAYDPDGSTSHKNPAYDAADWAKNFDVVVHDECSSDVKDLPVIDRILKPHRDGLPGVVLHCAMHCYRSQGFPKAVTPWFEFTGLPSTGHGASLPIAVRFVDTAGPDHPDAGRLDHGQRGALQQQRRPPIGYRARAGPRHAGEERTRLRGRLDEPLPQQGPRLRHDPRPPDQDGQGSALPGSRHPRPALGRRQARRRPPEAGEEGAPGRLRACKRFTTAR